MSVDTLEYFTTNSYACARQNIVSYLLTLKMLSPKILSPKSQISSQPWKQLGSPFLLYIICTFSEHHHFQETVLFTGDMILLGDSDWQSYFWMAFYSDQNVQNQMCIIITILADRWIL